MLPHCSLLLLTANVQLADSEDGPRQETDGSKWKGWPRQEAALPWDERQPGSPWLARLLPALTWMRVSTLSCTMVGGLFLGRMVLTSTPSTKSWLATSKWKRCPQFFTQVSRTWRPRGASKHLSEDGEPQGSHPHTLPTSQSEG